MIGLPPRSRRASAPDSAELSHRIGTARTPVKRLTAAVNYFGALRGFARVLGTQQPAPTRPDELAGTHIRAFVKHYDGQPKRQHSAFKQLRSVLRNDPEFPEDARQALFDVRVKEPEVIRPGAYTDDDWQAIMTAVRRDVRLARERIEAGQRRLARWRGGDPTLSRQESERGALLDIFDRTGDLPRQPGGKDNHTNAVLRASGFQHLAASLCLTRRWLRCVSRAGPCRRRRWPAVRCRSGWCGR